MSELGFPTPVQGGDDPALAPIDTQGGKSLLGANLLGQTKRLLVDSNNNLLVSGNVVVTPSSTGVNIFAFNNSVPSGTETTILSYTTTFPFHISQLIGWGNADAEFSIKVNGIQVGGGFSSPSERTLVVLYEVAPIPTHTGDTITVTGIQVSGASKKLKVNLLGE